jgi:hypothetical protein
MPTPQDWIIDFLEFSKLLLNRRDTESAEEKAEILGVTLRRLVLGEKL